MKNMKPRVTVGILSWNRRDALRTALESVRKQTIFNETEVVVVDNCSTDGSREMLRNEYDFIRLVERAENSGLAEGRNILVRLANAPVVFWMDDDCELVEQDCLEQLVREMEAQPEYAVVFARILEGGSEPAHVYVPSDISRKQFEMLPSLPASFASGGTCVRKQQFLDLGGYDSDFFRMMVENAYAYRVFQARGVIRYYPAVTIIHRPHSFGRNFRVISYYSTRNKLLGVWRYLPLSAALVFTGFELPARFCYALRSPARMLGFFQGVTAFLAKLPRCLLRERKAMDREAFSKWAFSRHYLIRSLNEFHRLPTHYSLLRFALMGLKLGLGRRFGWRRIDPFVPPSLLTMDDAEKKNSCCNHQG